MKWYQNRYFLAAIVGLILGIFGGLQQLNLLLDRTHPEYASILGAVLMGIALFVQVLPTPKEIVTPTIRLVSQERITAAPSMDAPETTLTTDTAVTTVVVGPPPRLEKRPDADGVAVVQAEADKGAVT